MTKSIAALSLFLFLLTGCGRHEQNLANVNTTNLSQLENVRVQPVKEAGSANELNQLRARALKDTAMSLAAQAGLAYSSEQLNANIEQDNKHLDTIFNFGAMILDHGVLPPVLEESNNNLNLADPNTIRIADKTYKIHSQARFATTPPNWREYLHFSFAKPELPDKSLLPRNKEEHIIWKQAIRTGWERGIQQSYSIFQQNLARLKRDYQGMVLYRKLLAEKMISPPYVARTELGITGDGSDMRINDQVLRIVELPKLQTNGRHWNAVVVKRHD